MPRTLLSALALGVRAGAVLLAAAVPLVGCGTPPELTNQPAPIGPATRSTTRGPVTPTIPSASPAPSGSATPTFAELTAVDCRGNPTGEQMITLLRRSAGLPSGVAMKVAIGPRCAGTWQYAVIEVSGHEPLQVVSNGRPTSLALVTAGTDVCSIPVRTQAPPGIRALACDAVLSRLPGA